MTTTKTRVKIGLTFVPREIEIEVGDPDAFKSEFDAAVAEGGVWWVTDSTGRRHGLVVDKVAFVEIEPGDRERTIGFA